MGQEVKDASKDLDYFRRQGVPDGVINFSAREREAKLAAQSASVKEDLGLFMGHVWKQRFAAAGLGVALGFVGGSINLISEPTLSKAVVGFCGLPAFLVGWPILFAKTRRRVGDQVYDWSGNWNDDRRARERATEIAANSWEFDGGQMWIEKTRIGSRGKTEIVLGTKRGEIITHNIQHVRRPT